MKTSMHIIIVLIASLAAAAAMCNASCPAPSSGSGCFAQDDSDICVTILVTHISTGEPLADMYIEIVELSWHDPFWCGYTCKNGCCDFLLRHGEFLATVIHNDITWPCVFKLSSDVGSDCRILINIPINPDIG
jgi:hypothetical protein